jgi:hypothetical protein
MSMEPTGTDAAPVFYQLAAQLLEEGMSTADGQDVLSVSIDDDGTVYASVYTPRSDDLALDEQNRAEPEARVYGPGELVALAVFSDTDVDGSDATE